MLVCVKIRLGFGLDFAGIRVEIVLAFCLNFAGFRVEILLRFGFDFVCAFFSANQMESEIGADVTLSLTMNDWPWSQAP